MDFKDCIEINNNVWFLKIKVVPNSTKTEITEMMADWRIKIRVKWIPEKWIVNLELIKFISYNLWVDRKNIKIISWATDRNKLIRVDF